MTLKMMISNCYQKVLVFVVAVTMQLLVAAPSPGAEAGWRVNQNNKDMMLRYLRPALRTAGGFGRILYSSICYEHGQPVPFPELTVSPMVGNKMGLAAVRSVFRDDRSVTVEQDRSGMVRIAIGKPQSAILQTKIRSLSLKPSEQYNPGLAIVAIEKSKDIQVAMKKLDLRLPDVVVLDMNVVEPARGLPHLPAALAEITLDQALDLVARTFGGIAYCGICADRHGARLVSMDFFGVTGTSE